MAIRIVKKKSTSILRKGNGDTLPPTVPARVSIPEQPVYRREVDGERALHDEQQVTRVAYLMAKGVRDKGQLMKLLEINDYRAIERYIARAHAQWEMLGSMSDLTRARGEGLMRLDLIEQELWAEAERSQGFEVTDKETGRRYKVEGDSRATIVALDKILDVQKHRDMLNGLTQKTVERIGTPAAESTEFTRRVESHERLSRVAQMLLAKLDGTRQPKTIDGTSGA